MTTYAQLELLFPLPSFSKTNWSHAKYFNRIEDYYTLGIKKVSFGEQLRTYKIFLNASNVHSVISGDKDMSDITAVSVHGDL